MNPFYQNNNNNNNTAQTRCFRLTLLVFLLVTICSADTISNGGCTNSNCRRNQKIATAFRARQTSRTSRQRVVPPTRSIYNPETGPLSMPWYHQTPVAVMLGLLTGMVFARSESGITKVSLAVMSGLVFWWLISTDFTNGGLAIALGQLYAHSFLYCSYLFCTAVGREFVLFWTD